MRRAPIPQFALMAALVALAACRHDVMQSPPEAAPVMATDAAPAAPVVAVVPVAKPDVPRQFVARVLADDGTPIAGARVVALDPQGHPSDATTDAHGRVWLEAGKAGYWYVRAESGGLVSRWSRIEHESGWSPVDVRLVEPAALRGVVVDAKTDAPVANAEVSVLQGGAVTETWTESLEAPFATITTDAEGQFGPVTVPRGLVVTARARTPGRPRAERAILVPERGEPDRAVVRIESGGLVTGHVRLPDGAPAVGAHVNALDWVEGDPTGAPGGVIELMDQHPDLAGPGLGADGAFRLEGLPLGAKYYVTARAKGWASARAAPVFLTEDAPTATVELVVRRAASVDLRVVDPEGRPVADAKVYELWPAEQFIHGREIPPDGEPGRRHVGGLTPATAAIEIHAHGFVPAQLVVHLGEGGTREETVRLVRSVSIRGRVVDDRGQPVKGVSVGAGPVAGPSFEFNDERDNARSAADGSFEIHNLAPGGNRIGASDVNYSQTKDAEDVVVDAPGDGVVIRLVRRGKVAFRLRPPAGAAAPKHLELIPWADNGAVGCYAERGAFEIPYLDPGDRKFRLLPEGFAAVDVAFRIAPGETTDLGEIALDEGATLTSRVVDPQGRPVPRAAVVLVQRQSQGDPRTTCDGDGGFTLPHLSGGDNEIELRREGFLVERVRVRGDAPPATLVLHRGGLLRVSVVDAAGAGASSLIEAVRSGASVGKGPEKIYTDERGHGEGRLAAGRYALRLNGKPAGDLEIVEGGELDMRLTRP